MSGVNSVSKPNLVPRVSLSCPPRGGAGERDLGNEVVSKPRSVLSAEAKAEADNTDLGFDYSRYHAQPHPIIAYYSNGK